MKLLIKGKWVISNSGTNRGIIKENMFADITIFNLNKIRNLSTFNEPNTLPKGINHVLVNGKTALENGKIVGNSGKILSKTF